VGERRGGWVVWWWWGGGVGWGGVGYFLIPMIAIYLHILNVRGYPFVYLAVG